jgi:hypothetical protein
VVTGTPTSFNIYMAKGANGAGRSIELLNYDEVSTSDTLIDESPVTSIDTPVLTSEMCPNGTYGYSHTDPTNYIVYHIDHPEHWPTNKEINFGQNMRGIHFNGTWSTGAANTYVVLTLGDDTIFPKSISYVYTFGGTLGGVTNLPTYQFPVNCKIDTFSTNAVGLENSIACKPGSTRAVIISHKDAYAALNTVYNVWMLYTIVP